MTVLLEEIDQRLAVLYDRLARGHDAPPALRLRLEGLLEAAELLKLASQDELLQRVERRHDEHASVSLRERCGDDWRRAHPFPQIPAYMERAPVSPSTSD